MTHRPFPKSLGAVGVVIALAACLFAAHIAWEQTVWTWTRGPQMIGFSLMHSGIGVLLYLIILVAGPLWLVLTLFFAWRSRSFGTLVTRGSVLAYASAWGLLLVPAGYWQRVFIERMARSPHAQDLIYYAAVKGDIKAVEAYIAHGVPVNARTCNDALTPTHGAARAGNVEMLAYLLSSGADVNATSAYGDSPLTDAAEQDRTAAMDLLKRHGGKAIEGTPEQRDAAIKATVRRTDSTPCVDAQQGVPADAARPAGERRD